MFAEPWSCGTASPPLRVSQHSSGPGPRGWFYAAAALPLTPGLHPPVSALQRRTGALQEPCYKTLAGTCRKSGVSSGWWPEGRSVPPAPPQTRPCPFAPVSCWQCCRVPGRQMGPGSWCGGCGQSCTAPILLCLSGHSSALGNQQ